jgi:ABC-type glycerol-3-phosphate transport system substrate-binding protein
VDPRTGEEHLYALPYLGELHSLNYHRDALAAHGLSERDLPHSWEEFERLARKLHDPEQMQYGMTFDLSTTFFCQNTYVPILSAFAGDAVDAQGRIDVTSREAAGTFELVKRWYREGLIPQGALTIYQSADDFRAGIAVMFANWQSRGAWAMRTMPEGEERIGIGPCPGSEEVGSLLAHYVGVIPKASPVPAEAARLLLEAIVYDLQPGVVKAGCMSPIKHIYDQHRPGYGQEVVPASIQRLRDLVDADFRVPAWMIPLRPTVERGYVIPDPLTWQRVSDIMGVEFQKYLREEIPAEEALGRAKRQIDALYE